MDNQIPFGARNHIALDRTLVLGDTKYLPGETLIVSADIAKDLLEKHYGELVSIEYEDNKVQYGASQHFRKL
jgi:hypothetical protein